MQRMRNGLLMILIVAVALPAPLVSASAPAEDSHQLVSEGVGSSLAPAAELPAASSASSSEVEAAGSAESLPNSPQDVNTPPVTSSPAPPVQPVVPPPLPSPAPPAAATGRLIISKVNPDEPEVIELFNPGVHVVDMAGARLEFVPKGKAPVLLKEFQAGQVAPGKFLVIGDGHEAEPFDSATKDAISLAGVVRLSIGDYEEELAFGEGSTLNIKQLPLGERFIQRCQADQTTFIVTEFNSKRLGKWPNCQPPNTCAGLRLSEIGAHTAEQFIELRNSSDEPVNLAGCQVATKRTRAAYTLPEYTLDPGAFYRIAVTETELSLAKTSGTVYLLSAGGDELDEVMYAKLAKGTAWAFVDGEWRQTYAPTPGEENNFQRWRSCDPGKQINEATGQCVTIPVMTAALTECAPGYYRHPETGRCRKVAAAKVMALCKEGYYRSEETGRCRSIASVVVKTLKPCPDGEFRNPATGRCKKIAAVSDIAKECPEGFERNPATNRCRKLQSATPPKADFAPESVKQVAGAVWGWWVAGGVGALALGYAAWEWRWELRRLLRRGG